MAGNELNRVENSAAWNVTTGSIETRCSSLVNNYDQACNAGMSSGLHGCEMRRHSAVIVSSRCPEAPVLL